MKRIVIVSDCTDVAFNEMRATIVSYLDREGVTDFEVEPLVSVKEFSIINAAFLIRLLAETYDPKNTLFLVVVNALRTNIPGRARIAGETANGFRFVGANTGALNWLIQDLGLKKLYEFSGTNLTGTDFVSFGGKFFHAPMAAKLITLASLEGVGIDKKMDFLTDFSIPEGAVVHIDNFGVIKLKSKIPENFRDGEMVEIFVNGIRSEDAVFTKSMKDCSDGTLALLPGSSLGNLAEIAKVRVVGTAQQMDISIGDIVTFRRKDEKK